MGQDIFVRIDGTAQSTSNVAIDSFYLPANNFESRSADWWKNNSALINYAGGEHDKSNLSTATQFRYSVVTNEIGSRPPTELLTQQAGNKVLITQGDKPVAWLMIDREEPPGGGNSLRVHSFKGHRVLTPVISQDELAEEMFGLE